MTEEGQRRYRALPVTRSFSGAPRRVGVEIELTGPDVEHLVAQVQSVFGGTRRFHSDFEWTLENTEFGTFRIEMDSDLLKKIGRQEEATGEWVDHLASLALARLSQGLVPCEIVTPPIPWSRLAELDRLIANLRADGAKGTRDALWNAFGLHLNPEVPSCAADSILAYLRAFLCLHDWLREVEDVDISRRLSPYVRSFDAAFVSQVMAPDYRPNLSTLIDDYLYANPSRNRALDLLPLFTWLDAPRVRSVVTSTLVKARPTYHYRLPNCEIDDPQWGIHQSWNRWCEVEELAADALRLEDVCAAYRLHLESLTPDFLDPWSDKVKAWLACP